VTATVLLAEDERDIADLVRYHVEQTGRRSREIGGPGPRGRPSIGSALGGGTTVSVTLPVGEDVAAT
jgi:hypothetical protein